PRLVRSQPLEERTTARALEKQIRSRRFYYWANCFDVRVHYDCGDNGAPLTGGALRDSNLSEGVEQVAEHFVQSFRGRSDSSSTGFPKAAFPAEHLCGQIF